MVRNVHYNLFYFYVNMLEYNIATLSIELIVLNVNIM